MFQRYSYMFSNHLLYSVCHVYKCLVVFTAICSSIHCKRSTFCYTVFVAFPFISIVCYTFSRMGIFLMLHIVLRIRFAFIRKHNSTNDLTFVRITFSHYLLKLCRFFFTNWKIWTGWTELDDWRNGIELLMPIHWPRLSSYSLNFLDYFLVILILRW